MLQYRDFLAQPIPTWGPRWNPEKERPIRAAAGSDLIPGVQSLILYENTNPRWCRTPHVKNSHSVYENL